MPVVLEGGRADAVGEGLLPVQHAEGLLQRGRVGAGGERAHVPVEHDADLAACHAHAGLPRGGRAVDDRRVRGARVGGGREGRVEAPGRRQRQAAQVLHAARAAGHFDPVGRAGAQGLGREDRDLGAADRRGTRGLCHHGVACVEQAHRERGHARRIDRLAEDDRRPDAQRNVGRAGGRRAASHQRRVVGLRREHLEPLLECPEDLRADARIVPRHVDVSDRQRRPARLGVGQRLDAHADLPARVVEHLEDPQARVRELDRRSRVTEVARNAGVEVHAGDGEKRGLTRVDRARLRGHDDRPRPAHHEVARLGALEAAPVVGTDGEVPGRAVGEPADRRLGDEPGVRNGRHRGRGEAVVDAVARDVGIDHRVPRERYGPGRGEAAGQEDQREDQEEPPGNADEAGPRGAVTPSADSVTGTHAAPRTDPRTSDASVPVMQSPFHAMAPCQERGLYGLSG